MTGTASRKQGVFFAARGDNHQSGLFLFLDPGVILQPTGKERKVVWHPHRSDGRKAIYYCASFWVQVWIAVLAMATAGN